LILGGGGALLRNQIQLERVQPILLEHGRIEEGKHRKDKGDGRGMQRNGEEGGVHPDDGAVSVL
jgi:hypothetical protein